MPMSYNPWLYANANPVKYTDPSGRVPQWLIHQLGLNSIIPGCEPDVYSFPYVTTDPFRLQLEDDPGDDPPSVAALVGLGIPLTMAIIGVEIGLGYAEYSLAAVTISQPGLAFATIPLELVLFTASMSLIDLEIAYWSYTYRVATAPVGEPVEFEFLPYWGLK